MWNFWKRDWKVIAYKKKEYEQYNTYAGVRYGQSKYITATLVVEKCQITNKERARLISSLDCNNLPESYDLNLAKIECGLV